MYCLYNENYGRYTDHEGNVLDIPYIFPQHIKSVTRVAESISNQNGCKIKIYQISLKLVDEVIGTPLEKQLEKIAECLPPKMAKWAVQKMLNEQSDMSYDYEDLLRHFQDMVDELKAVFS